MSDLCVPNSALESPEEFHQWYLRMTARLFPATERIYVPQIEEKVIMNDLEKTFERVLSWANYVYNGNWNIVSYKYKPQVKRLGQNKPKGSTSSLTDVISVSVNIIMSYYNIIQEKLASIIGINRSTISYYIKRHKSNCIYPDYLNKYNQLLISLRNEGLISAS